MNTKVASSAITDLEKAVNQQINQYRASKKLPPLSVDPQMTQIARIHSENMANGKVRFSHDGFEGRAKAITIPYQSVAENLAYNMATASRYPRLLKVGLKVTATARIWRVSLI